MLKLKVTNQNIEILEVTPLGYPLVSGSKGEYECQFEFDSTWEGFTKTAVFYTYATQCCECSDEEPAIEVALIDNDTCTIPVQVLVENHYIKIGIYGIKGEIRRPTLYSDALLVWKGAIPDEGAVDPPDGFYDKIILIMEQTKEIAQSVRDDADAGKFDGKGVATGGLAGQILAKKTDKDFDTEWKDVNTLGVSSWNGRKGVVVPENGDYTYNQITGLVEELEKAKKGATYIHKQRVVASEWIVNHNLNKYPSVTVVDSANTAVIGEVEYLDKNNLKIVFTSSFSGLAYLN